MTAFILPDLGEGLKEADLVEWLVKEGQSVQVDEIVLLVETAKAVVELPAPSAGIITRLAVAEGSTVKVGQILFEYEDYQKSDQQTFSQKENEKPCISEQKESVSVVGELHKSDQGKINLYEIEPFVNEHKNIKSQLNKSETRKHDIGKEYIANSTPVCITTSPKTMAFAKKLGLQDLLGRTYSNELTLHDLLTIYQETTLKQKHNISTPKEYYPIKGARKVMAQIMIKAHHEIPAATLFEDADITHWRANTDITIKVINAMISACTENPIMNAWYDSESMSIKQHQHIDLGLAVNSERGLFVPVIKQINLKKEDDIRLTINKLQQQINQQSISLKDLKGGTITLSNFGSLSGRYATPIIVPPQVCIVGIGKSREEVVVKNGKIQVGRILPISLSFDHRAATGAEAAQFMQSLIKWLELG